MATLTVLEFENVDGAGEALKKIRTLQKLHIIKIIDAAIVTWPEGRKSPKTKQLVSMTGVGAFQGAFWGMLFGLIFLVPFFGMAFGAAMGAISGAFQDYGIDDDFIKMIREKITEGTSALFLMTTDEVPDKVSDALKEFDFEIIATNLSQEQEDRLIAIFSEE